MSSPEPAPQQTPRAGRREWIGLAVIALPCLLYAMDLTVLNLALPRISADLRPSSAQLLWMVDIYGFFVAGMLVTMGNLGDRFGRRRVLMLGAAAFGVASVFAAFARSATTLILARAALGVAGATLAPSTLSLIRGMFADPRQRATAVGVWISSYSIGGAIGPLLGGLVLQHARWGAVFLLAVPVMVLLLVLGPWLLPESRDPVARRMDLPSAALSLLAVLATVYGLKEYAQGGFRWVVAATIVGGPLVGVLFVVRQRRLADPLIDVRLFQVPAVTASLAIYLLGTLVSFGAYVFIGQYTQLVLGLTPIQAGLWMLPWSAGFIGGSLVSPLLTRRVHRAYVIAGGLLLAAAGYAALATVGSTGLAGMTAGISMMSLGLAPVFTLGTALVVGAAPPAQAGAAAALSETSSELGGALGIALLGSLGTAVYRHAIAASPLAGVPARAALAARDTLGAAVSIAAELPGRPGDMLLHAARGAFTEAVRVLAIVCAIALFGTAIAAALALRGVRAEEDGQ